MLTTGAVPEKGFFVFEPGAKLPHGEELSRVWVIVANNRQAYIYRRAEDTSLVLIAHAQDKPSQIDTLNEHIISPRMMHDHHEHQYHAVSDDFTGRLAEWLELAAKEKSFEQLILVAPTETLNRIRADLPKHVQECISAEVDAELTGMSIHELHERLESAIP